MKKITVVGAGYVGISLASLLAQNNQLTLLDIDPNKVDKINNRLSPINDPEVAKFLSSKNLDLIATTNKKKRIKIKILSLLQPRRILTLKQTILILKLLKM